MDKNYHALIQDRIFMCGADDVQSVVNNENVKVVVDLREEANHCAAVGKGLKWINISLVDDPSDSGEIHLTEAIEAVTTAYNQGEKVVFHCGGGKGRTGMVAYGTLMKLGFAQSLDEAEEQAKSIRPILNIKPTQRLALEKLFE